MPENGVPASDFSFVHLRTRSTYSLLDGMLHPKDIVQWAQKQRMPAIAMADKHNLFGVMEFALAANTAGVQPLISASVTLTGETETLFPDARSRSLVLIAQNAEGYANLIRLITRLYMPITPQHEGDYEQMQLNFDQLAEHAEGLILLCGGLGAPLGDLLLQHSKQAAAQWLDRAREVFGDRVFVELQRHNLPQETEGHKALVALADSRHIPLVATNDCRFPSQKEFPYHDALRAIERQEILHQTETRQRLNESYFFRSTAEMQKLFSDLPDALGNTLHVARLCQFTLSDLSMKPLLPAVTSLPSNQSADDYLKALGQKGLKKRLAHKNITFEAPEAQPYKERLKDELTIIQNLGFSSYFLIVADFISWSKKNNIPVGPGRGSGVGSLVAWALEITALDPLQWNLLFERFLNPERVSVPDFDIDFCTDKREQVIHYVRQNYGDECVSQIITFGKLRSRGALRDIGRVLGLPYAVSDRICKMLPKEDPTNPQDLPTLVRQVPALQQKIEGGDEEIAQLWEYATVLEGTYRQASTHAAGVVISDRSLFGKVALYSDPKNGLRAIQHNMKSAEKAGLVKFDFLGLSTLTIMTACIDDIARIYDTEVNLDDIPLDDTQVFTAISEGHTDGMFQLESPGMRRVAVQLKPDSFADIIAMVALFRPGPMENIPRFIRCKHGKEKINYPHPLLESILSETYGIAVYQEQIMQMTQTLAGFSLGKSDQVRRAMGKKDPKTLARMGKEFIEAAHQLHQIPPADGEKIFETIQAFAAYGFNKSHSAAYGLIAYWTGWLKTHFPDCFMNALLNNALQSHNTIAQYFIDAKRMEINILPLDINRSEAHFYIEGKRQIRYGLAAIRGVGVAIIQALSALRDQDGAFRDLGDFALRTRDLGINKRTLEALICSGAMDSIIPNRQSAFKMSEELLNYAKHCREIPQGDGMLFTPEFPDPPKIPDDKEWSGDTLLDHEYQVLGLHFSNHPLDLYSQHLRDFGVMSYSDLSSILGQGGNIRIAGFAYDGILTKTRPLPARGKQKAQEAQPLYILKMSDANQNFSVNIEGQKLIDQVLEILQTEKLLLIDGYARPSQIAWHITGVRVRALRNAIPEQEERFSIRLRDAAPMETLAKLLQDAEDHQGSDVEIIVPTKMGETTVKLETRHRISLELRRTISALPNVQFHAITRDYMSEMLSRE